MEGCYHGWVNVYCVYLNKILKGLIKKIILLRFKSIDYVCKSADRSKLKWILWGLRRGLDGKLLALESLNAWSTWMFLYLFLPTIIL